jgi:hypothetical protein
MSVYLYGSSQKTTEMDSDKILWCEGWGGRDLSVAYSKCMKLI